jgi:hypothetical protein
MYDLNQEGCLFIRYRNKHKIPIHIIYMLSRLWKNYHDWTSVQCLHVPSKLPVEGFPWNLVLVTSMKVPWETTKLVKIGQNVGHLSWILLLPEIQMRYKNILCDIQYFILLTVTCSWTAHTESIAAFHSTVVKRTRHNVTLYVQRVSCFFFEKKIPTFNLSVKLILAHLFKGLTQEDKKIKDKWFSLQEFKDDFRRIIVNISRKEQCRVSRNIIETHEAYLEAVSW